MKKKKLILCAIYIVVLLGVFLLCFKIYRQKMAIHKLAVMVNELDTQQSIIPNLRPYDEGKWIVTQYGDVAMDREICYTITSKDGLIIVDGGFEYEEPRLRRIIASYGNHVNAWILTHPDSDHITAFMDIYRDLQGISIDHVYTPEYPSIEILSSNASWDSFEALEEFRQLDIPQHEFVHRGDVLDVLGLKMQVISAYEDKIDEIADDLMNDGAMMFRLSGAESSILFCGDVGSASQNDNTNREIMTDYIMSLYSPEELHADYVQMAHHGFQGMMPEFYKSVHPRAAFFDAPAWLLNGDDPRFSDQDNVKLMTEMGCTLFTYYTSPNQIILK